jgi:arabinogalactan endo-1,4-beta-galactosidase
MIHFAGIEAASWFFLKNATVDYDYIGLSYHPMWHGTDTNLLQQTMTILG